MIIGRRWPAGIAGATLGLWPTAPRAIRGRQCGAVWGIAKQAETYQIAGHPAASNSQSAVKRASRGAAERRPSAQTGDLRPAVRAAAAKNLSVGVSDPGRFAPMGPVSRWGHGGIEAEPLAGRRAADAEFSFAARPVVPGGISPPRRRAGKRSYSRSRSLL